jgi:hypothetical protein
MATRRYGLSLQEADFRVTEAVGSATAADAIEVTIDFDASGVNKQRALDALEKIMTYIAVKQWPPA